MNAAASELRVTAGRAPARLVLRRRHVVALAALVPAVLAGLYVSGNVRASLAQRTLRAQWATLSASPLDAAGLSTTSLGPDEPIARLVVAAAGIDLIVVEGGGTLRAPAHRPATVRPGLPGVSVIDGSRFGRGNMFLNLPRLAPGDSIVVQTRAGETRYRVTGIATMPASSIDDGKDATMPALLLVSPARAWGSTQRIVVRAEAVTGR